MKDQSRVIGIGSPRASLEANFALRELVGEDRFYVSLNGTDRDLLHLTLDVLCNADGCLARTGAGGNEITVWDTSHFTRAGSTLLVRGAAPTLLAGL